MGGRLYAKAVFLGYRRNRVNQHTNQSLIKVQGLNDKKDTDFYLGKRVAYVYRAKTVGKETNSKTRVMWGRVIKSHGNNGVVRATFKKNLPPKAIGGPVRIMLFPSNI